MRISKKHIFRSDSSKHTTVVEEIVNSVTHGLGLLLGIAGIIYLLVVNSKTPEFWRLLGISMFGLSVILTYTISTLYHSLYYTKAKTLLLKLDYSAVFLSIAGTYTAFVLIAFRNSNGLIVLFLVWLMSISGTIYKFKYVEKLKSLQVLMYVFMGWIGILLFREPKLILSSTVIAWLVLGGFFYTAGTIFCSWKSLKFNHGIWHVFVLSGTACHFLALLYL